MWAAALVALALAPQPLDAEPTPRTIAGLPLAEAAGYGARLGFAEYEAENGRTNGELLGPDRTFGTIPAEASGRRAVRLSKPGDYVEFTLAEHADGLVVRAAIPDTADGRGQDATLGVYVDGERVGSLTLSSRYGWFYGRYPFSNDPKDGGGHHVFDEARLLFPHGLRAGGAVRLMVGPQDRAGWYVIDLADFEVVTPSAAPPEGALDIRSFGADPTGRRDSSEALQWAVDEGRRRRAPVWIPPGEFKVTRHLQVDRVAIVGAGPWFSILRGKGVGIYGRTDGRQSEAVTLRDFSIIGEVTERKDHEQVNGVGGAMGAGSVIENLWIQHTKVGLWFDGPMDGITIVGLRVTDVLADGLNFRRGVSHAVVEDSLFRGTGDDGLAMWSQKLADHDNVLRRNTVVAPVLANGIALYGGRDVEVSGNLVADTVTQGGGLHVGNRFGAVPNAGTITLRRNLLARTGSWDPNWKQGVGALWFYALDAPMTGRVVVKDTRIEGSSQAAIHFRGEVRGVEVERVAIEGAGTWAVQPDGPGAASFKGVTAKDLGLGGVRDCGTGFMIEDLGGNQGWESRACRPH